MNVPFVDLKAQYHTLRNDIDNAMQRVIERTAFIMGDEVAQFEQAFADYCGVAYGVGVDSGTSALEMALRAHDIGEGDEVIIPANTFIASALAISYCGATPVLVDIDPDTYMMDTALVADAITERTAAIMPVHLYGHAVDMDAILALAIQHDLVVIEDASQAHGALYKGRRVGSFGHTAAFSLYPAKNLGAFGDAGVLVTDDPAIAEKLRLLRNYGSTKKYHHDMIGYNHRLDTLQAAVLCAKLPYLDAWGKARRAHAAQYAAQLADTPLVLPKSAETVSPVHHVYVVRTAWRDELQAYLKERGIGTVIHYPIPIHLQPAYAELGYEAGDFPVTERYAREILSLPMFAELTDEQIDAVVAAIEDFFMEKAMAAFDERVAVPA